jgi:protein SCO1/2
MTTPSSLPTRRRLLLAAGATTLLAACDRTPKPSFKSVDITGAEYARRLRLSDADGRPRSLDEFKGKVVVVFFGYTQCPDVCPTTLQQLVETKRLLGPQGDKLQGVFVTVDPARDTPEILKAYTGAFDPTFIALRGTDDEIADAAKEFKIFYRKVDGATPQGYTIDHTAASYVIDPQGRPRLYVRHGMPAADLAADIKLLLEQKG